jgi:hypothetical protein
MSKENDLKKMKRKRLAEGGKVGVNEEMMMGVLLKKSKNRCRK